VVSSLSNNSSGQVVYIHMTVTKQHHLVLATERVTVDVALHWPCITDLVLYHHLSDGPGMVFC